MTHTEDKFGRVDILVNNAGLFSVLKMQSYHEINIEEWDRVMACGAYGWPALPRPLR